MMEDGYITPHWLQDRMKKRKKKAEANVTKSSIEKTAMDIEVTALESSGRCVTNNTDERKGLSESIPEQVNRQTRRQFSLTELYGKYFQQSTKQVAAPESGGRCVTDKTAESEDSAILLQYKIREVQAESCH
jgi:hypothetical protein